MSIMGLIVWKTKFLTRVDDWIRLATMTLIALFIANALGVSGLAYTAILAIGVALDVHDIVEKAMEGKPVI